MLKEFKEFAFKGSLLDLAIALILGGAFARVVASLVVDVIMPPVGLLLGRVDFASLYLNLSGQTYASMAEARAAGAPVIAFGSFLNAVINFVIVALVLFLLIRQVNRVAKSEESGSKEESDEVTEKVKDTMEEREKEGKEAGGEAPQEASGGEPPQPD